MANPAGTQSRSQVSTRDRFRGCLLGGAVGDALGAPVEFMSRAEILQRFGPPGITRYVPAYGGLGTITDDTQMTLFTAEGLLRAWVRGSLKGISSYTSVTSRAYLRWLQTQSEVPAFDLGLTEESTGWLFRQPALHHCRAPGNTCLSALRQMHRPGEPATNDSKGCGGVMRIAPVGLFLQGHGQATSPERAFELGTELAALTHGHPTGSLTGGVLAMLVLNLADGAALAEALVAAKEILVERPHHEETLQAIEQAEALAASGARRQAAIAALGQGWVAEEALAISIYCALVAKDFRDGIILAVNHDGDSDSTGSITGNLLGSTLGVGAIPAEWLEQLELRQVIQELADDLCDHAQWDIGEYSGDRELSERIWRKYPGV